MEDTKLGSYFQIVLEIYSRASPQDCPHEREESPRVQSEMRVYIAVVVERVLRVCCGMMWDVIRNQNRKVGIDPHPLKRQ